MAKTDFPGFWKCSGMARLPRPMSESVKEGPPRGKKVRHRQAGREKGSGERRKGEGGEERDRGQEGRGEERKEGESRGERKRGGEERGEDRRKERRVEERRGLRREGEVR